MRALGILFFFAMGCSTQPGISKCVPEGGSVTGGEDIVIEGSNFAEGSTVHFGSSEARVGSIRPAAIEVKSPPSSELGPVDVVVTTPDGKTIVLAKGFSYRQETAQ